MAAYPADVEAMHEGALCLAFPLGDGVDHPLRRRQMGRCCWGRQLGSRPAEIWYTHVYEGNIRKQAQKQLVFLSTVRETWCAW